jgi:RNA polymerase sigma-70 factor (subfamily 1)
MSLQTPDSAFLNLLAAARAGDGTSLGRLLERVRPRLLKSAFVAGTARPRLRGREADLVQETLKDAVVGFDQFVGFSEGGWHQWLMRIFENNLTDMYRYGGAAKRDEAKEQRLDTDCARTLPDGGETPSKAFAKGEDLDRLEKALQRLSKGDREIIHLRDTDGFSFAAIARLMGKPSSESARKQYDRAAERLKKAFEELGS